MQMELVDCGAAALSIILSYYGCSLPLEVISRECLVSREGVSIAQLVKAAQRFGLDAKVYETLPCEQLELPLILFWNRKHYVVLEGIKKNKIYINDPKQGKSVIDRQTFKQNFSQRVIQLRPNTQFKKNKFSLWRKDLIPVLSEHRGALIKLSFALFLLTWLNLSPLIFTKLFLDNPQQTNTLLLWSMLLVVSIQFILYYKSRQLFRRLEHRFATALSTKLLRHLIHLPLRFFAFRRPIDLVYRLQGVERLASEQWFAGCSLITASLQIALVLLLLSFYRPAFAVLALLLSLGAWGSFGWFRQRAESVESRLKSSLRDLSIWTASYFSTVTQIKAQCAESRYMQRWSGIFAQYLKYYRHYAQQQQQAHLCFSFLFSLSYSALLAVGVYWVSAQEMTFSELMACQILFLSLHEALLQKSKWLTQKKQMEMDLQGFADISQSSLEPVPTQVVQCKHSEAVVIQLIDVTFGYSREFKPLLAEVNMTIAAGEQVAIVGASGSGKSTLVHLLSGLYQPWSGTILLNDIPLANYTAEQRAKLVGVVSQQHFFYQGSVADNLCLWQSYTKSELLSVLYQACLAELSLDYQLTEGASNLSGGQRQRLEIARTLLAKPPILIFDEATSALDSLIEARIKKNLSQNTATKIIIAHRRNTLHDVDRIYGLYEGKLIEMTRQQLRENVLFAISG